MATTRSCLFPYSPAILLPVVGRRGRRCLLPPGLKTTAAQPRKLTATARPRLQPAQCQKRDGGGATTPPVQRLPADFLQEEKEKVMQHHREIVSVDNGCLYAEAMDMSARLCLAANDGLAMASHVMHSAELNLAAPNETSAETIHRTVRVCVSAFMAADGDSYQRKVSRETVASFLGALRGLAALSHILLEGALEAVSRSTPSTPT